MAALAAAALAFALEAGAQGRGSGPTGASGGTLGGGASAAANRGGAGGVGNPSPGGAPAAIGGPQQSSGPQGSEASRSGYLGGRETTPVTPPPPLPPGTTITALVVSRFGECSAQSRDADMGRVETVAQYLSHPQGGRSPSTARYLVADLREELAKPRPDLTLAGTYLGIASGMPVTPALVADVSKSLCATVSESAAQTIARIAETQRRRLTRGR